MIGVGGGQGGGRADVVAGYETDPESPGHLCALSRAAPEHPGLDVGAGPGHGMGIESVGRAVGAAQQSEDVGHKIGVRGRLRVLLLQEVHPRAGTPPESVHTDATVTLRPVDGAPTITKIALVTVGTVPGIDEAGFLEHAAAAKAGCPVSRALAGVPEITLEASLA